MKMMSQRAASGLLVTAIFLFAQFAKSDSCRPEWKPTLTFHPAQHLLLENGTRIKYSVSAVTRFLDVNEDGRVDLMVASGGRVWLHLATSNGRFEDKAAVTLPNGSAIDTGNRRNRDTTFALADLDNDGRRDILLTNDKQLYLLPRAGCVNNLPSFGPMRFLKKLDSNRFDVVDWDGDGDNDIISGDFLSYFRIYINKNLTLQNGTKLTNPAPLFYTPYPRALDVNGDGSPEIFYSKNWGSFQLFTKGSEEKYKRYLLSLSDKKSLNVRSIYKEHQAPEVADVDGDGIMDLITSGDTGDIVFFKGLDTVKQAEQRIEAMIKQYPAQLGYAMQNITLVYDSMYNSNRVLQEYVNNPLFPEDAKKSIYLWYLQLIVSYPQYFARQTWEAPNIASLAGYVWLVALESQPDTPAGRKLLSLVTKHEGYAAKLLEDRGILLINNNKAPEHKVKLVYDYMMLKDPEYYSIGVIGQSGYRPGKKAKFSGIRESGVNIFTGANYNENSFSSDCRVCREPGRSPRIMTFMAALAHEISHNELDQRKAKAFNATLFQRKYEILKRATGDHVIWKVPVIRGYDVAKTKQLFKSRGWWDGLSNWGTTLKNHFNSGQGKQLNKNSLRGTLGFFVVAPHESFAALANQYASDSKLMLDFAMERTRAGHPTCMDWFFLMADYYARGGSTIPMFTIDENGAMEKYEATVGRDARGYLNHVSFSGSHPGHTTYTCDLGEQGFVSSCTSS